MSALEHLHAEQLAWLADPVGAALFALLVDVQRQSVLADAAERATERAMPRDARPLLGPDASESVSHVRAVLVSYVYDGRDPVAPRRNYGGG